MAHDASGDGRSGNVVTAATERRKEVIGAFFGHVTGNDQVTNVKQTLELSFAPWDGGFVAISIPGSPQGRRGEI